MILELSLFVIILSKLIVLFLFVGDIDIEWVKFILENMF